MILIFFGPPGAGKGTQAKLIADHFNIPHLSTGDILRSRLLNDDELGIKLKKIIDSGQLVSDSILNEIVLNRIENQDCCKGFILDGYPRTKHQAKFLESVFINKKMEINKIIELDVDTKTIINRIKSRSNIEKREDDKEEVIDTRMNKYLSETKPLFDYYKGEHTDIYLVIDGNQEIDQIKADILKNLKNL